MCYNIIDINNSFYSIIVLVNNSSILAGVVNNDNKVIQSTTSTIEISGTKMRNYLCAGDFESFSKMLPPLPDAAKKEISSILSTSISCGMPLSRRSAKNESLIRQFIRLVI